MEHGPEQFWLVMVGRDARLHTPLASGSARRLNRAAHAARARAQLQRSVRELRAGALVVMLWQRRQLRSAPTVPQKN